MSELRKQGKKLLKNTLIIGVGQLGAKFLSILLLPLYTSNLSPADLGIIDLIITYASLAQPIFYMQIDQAIFRFLIAFRENKSKQSELIKIGIGIFFIQSVVLGLICFTLVGIFNTSFAVLLGLYAFFSTFQNFLMQITRGCDMNTSYSISSIIYSLSLFILTIYFIQMTNLTINNYFIISFISFSISILYLIFNLKVYINIKKLPKEAKSTTKDLLKYSLPLIPNALSWWVINVSDRTIIKIFLGDISNGIYSVANKFTNILSSVLSIFVLSWTESAAENINKKNKDRFFTSIIIESYKLILALSSIIIACLPFVYGLFIKGPEYSEAYWQIPILVISIAFNTLVSILGSVYVALEKTKEIAKTSVYCAVINIVVNLLLINFIGLTAASLSTLIAFLSMAIYRFIDMQKYIKVKVDSRTIFLPSIIISIMIILFYFNMPFLNLINIIICIFYTYSILIKYISIIKNKILRK